ncbi:EamA family transporter [Pseudodesulfovibrio cashew]|uniref:EamA family transporter n=1 Tax=Pseudodesulfovibrio cashew TaxID=2678688 RepID=A0A6I6JDM9_9BACT|nr:DMT family transporter [Pseudodesulfovibrio cashew]QGY40946.1 EamA family transporter [Pseudodesulfovibrio cashew]
MTWFFLSLSAAFCMASNSAYLKRFFSDVSPWEMSIIPFLYAAPLCAIGLLFVDKPEIGPGFYPAMAWVLPLTMVGFILHYRAIHLSPLSLTLPFLSFTPVFVLVSGDLILHETLSLPGMAGMLLVVAGGYVINLDSARFGILGPIKAIFREPGSLLMLIVAAIYALTSVGGKVMIIHSSPMYTSMLLFSLLGLLIPLVLIGTGKASARAVTRKPLLAMGSGLILFCEVLSHNMAMSMAAAAYMITIKRMAGIFSVIYGRVLFKERGISYRLAGTLIMTAGAAAIVIYG